MSIHKVLTLLIWLAGIVAFLIPSDSNIASILKVVVLFLIVAHAIEVAVFWKVLNKAPGSLAGHVFSTMLFGLFHIGPLKKVQESAVTR